MRSARSGVTLVHMSRALVALALLLSTFLISAPANADTADERWHRLASRDVCLERPSSVRGWHLREAAAAWTATGLVTIALRRSCEDAPSRISVRQFWAPGASLNGETSWPSSYAEGGWSETDPTQWIYPEATIRLNAANLRGASGDRRCWGWYVAAHEIGHALGLWHEDDRSRVMSSEFAFRSYCWRLDPADVADLVALGYVA